MSVKLKRSVTISARAFSALDLTDQFPGTAKMNLDLEEFFRNRAARGGSPHAIDGPHAMKLSQQSRNLFVTALLGGGAVAYVFFVFLPMQTKTVVLRDELNLQRAFVEQSLTLAGSISSVERELEAAREFAAALRSVPVAS